MVSTVDGSGGKGKQSPSTAVKKRPRQRKPIKTLIDAKLKDYGGDEQYKDFVNELRGISLTDESEENHIRYEQLLKRHGVKKGKRKFKPEEGGGKPGPKAKAAAGGAGAVSSAADDSSKAAVSKAVPATTDINVINSRLQSDPDLKELDQETRGPLEERDNDVVHAAGIDEMTERKNMMPETKLTEMTVAERELADWRNTHILSPGRVEMIVENVCKEFAPKMGFQNQYQRDVEVEYLARGFQELVCTILPELVSIANHTKDYSDVNVDGGEGGEVGKTKVDDDGDTRSNKRNQKSTEIQLRDLDLYCNVSRTLTPKLNGFINQGMMDDTNNNNTL